MCDLQETTWEDRTEKGRSIGRAIVGITNYVTVDALLMGNALISHQGKYLVSIHWAVMFSSMCSRTAH